MLVIRLNISESHHTQALQVAIEGLATSFCLWERDPGLSPEMQQMDSMATVIVMAIFMVESGSLGCLWMWGGIVVCVSV